MEKERFKKPTPQQLIDVAIGTEVEDPKEIAGMVAYAAIVIDRLYDNGDIEIPADRELRYYAGEKLEKLFPDQEE